MSHIPESAAWRGTRSEQRALEAALQLARGSYQTAILTGTERLSGASLRGKARKYSGRYASSRDSVLGRVFSAGIACAELRVGRGGKRVLVWGRVARRALAAQAVEHFARTPEILAERALDLFSRSAS